VCSGLGAAPRRSRRSGTKLTRLGRTRPGRQFRPRTGAAPGRRPRRGDGLSLRGRARPRLSRPAHASEGPRHAHARISLPATTDYWINDATGDPLFVLTATAKRRAGQDDAVDPRRGPRPRARPPRHRWSSTGRLQSCALRGDVPGRLRRAGRTARARRTRYPKVPSTGHAVPGPRGARQCSCTRRPFFSATGFWMRQVTRLKDGHQTQILTTLEEDVPAIEVAVRMFDRWRQENFFKYMPEEYALDALVDYGIEPDDPDRDVPTPHARPSTSNCARPGRSSPGCSPGTATRPSPTPRPSSHHARLQDRTRQARQHRPPGHEARRPNWRPAAPPHPTAYP